SLVRNATEATAPLPSIVCIGQHPYIAQKIGVCITATNPEYYLCILANGGFYDFRFCVLGILAINE
ncbi:MAG: hypothetical protein E7J89_10490, partial [Enterobacter asburiae]|nr:hypothetical protein [Enterobacter asburiae]